MLIYENFTECYLDLLQRVFTDPEFESAPRGQRIKEKIGVSFRINNPRHRLPTVIGRDFSTSYMVAELLWYLSGNNRTDWISRYSSFWKNISDDGETANSAYGARLFFPNEKIANARFSQYDYVVEELKKDRDSRRAVMHIRVPSDSLDAKLDMPCTLSLQFFIRDEKIHMVTSMRSSDLIFGIAYDIPAFTIFQEMLANEFGIEMGTYTHISNSLHIYEKHFGMVEEILKNSQKSIELSNKIGEMPKLPNDVIEKIPQIMSLEELIRHSTSSDEAYWLALHFDDFDKYWKDWVWILAAYACKTHKDLVKMIKCLDQISYEGYKLGKW